MHHHPLLDDNALRQIVAKKGVTVTPSSARYIVPIPDLNDGGAPMYFPNAKELNIKIKSGIFGSHIISAIMESSPQIVPTNGSDVVVINNITPEQAHAFHVLYKDVEHKHTVMDRKAFDEFFKTATGVAYEPNGNSVTYIPDNIGIHGDVYNMAKETFKQRHSHYGKIDDLSSLTDEKIRHGYYQKKANHSKGMLLKGSFSRKTETGTVQSFDHGAMVAVGGDTIVSLIHPNDIHSCYRKPDGGSLINMQTKEIDLPIAQVGEVLLAGRRAPERGGGALGKK